MILQELLVSLGYELDKDTLKNLKKFEDGVKQAAMRLLKLVTVAAAAGAAVIAFVATVERSTDILGKSAERIGIAVSELHALKFASEIATGSAKGLAGTLENLMDIAAEFRMGQGAGVGPFGFGFLGIAPESGDSPEELLQKIAAGLQKIEDIATRRKIASTLGIGNLFLLLEKGPDGIASLTKEAKLLGVVTAEDARIAAKFSDEFFRVFGQLVAVVKVLFASKLAPLLTDIVKATTDWIRANRELVSANIEDAAKAIGDILSIVFSIIEIGAKAVVWLVEAVGGLGNAIKILLVLFGLVVAASVVALVLSITLAVISLTAAVAALGVPVGAVVGIVLAVVAAIAAILAIVILIGLAVEDLVGFMQGKESFLDKLVDRFTIIEKVLEPVAVLILNLEKVFRAFWELLNSPMDSSAWTKFFKEVEGAARSMLEYVYDKISGILKLIPTASASAFIHPDTSKLASKALNALTPGGGGSSKGSFTSSLLGEATGSSVLSTILNQTININGGDPAEVQKAVERGVKKGIQDVAREAIIDAKTGIAK